MYKLSRNTIANFIGKGWTTLISMIFVPIYIDFMGIESYGIVGLYMTFLAFSLLLDFGLSTTLNRELARLSTQHREVEIIRSRNLVRTLEILYWLAALIFAIIALLLSPWIANVWIKSNQISTDSLQMAIMLMGCAAAFQFPFELYSGGLLGLELQVLHNSIIVTFATLRSLGTVFILWLFSPTIQAYFIWQAAISLLQTMITGIFLWLKLPSVSSVNVKPRFDRSILVSIREFASGMTGIGILSVILTQIDRLILSKALTLEDFGYYTLAATVASGIFTLASPIFTAVFPRFSQLISQGYEENLKKVYHRSCQILAVSLFPVTVIIALYSREIMLLWTGQLETAEHTYLILSLLIVGTTHLAMMKLPVALQFAYGWTGLVFRLNALTVVIVTPCLVLLTNLYGVVGSAALYLVWNIIYAFVLVSQMHCKILIKDKWYWFYNDFLLPMLGAIFVALPLYLLMSEKMNSSSLTLLWIAIALILTFLGSAMAAPFTRLQIISFVKHKFC